MIRFFRRLTEPKKAVDYNSGKRLQIPLGFERPEPLEVTIARMIRDQTIQHELAARGHETFEESNDFDVDDDVPVDSPWEEEFEGQFEKEVEIESREYEQVGKDRRKKREKVDEKTQASPVPAAASGG